MFKDCQTGGYNLASTQTTGQGLIALILLIAIADINAVLASRHSRTLSLQNYLSLLQ
jgi:hypothetical protein